MLKSRKKEKLRKLKKTGKPSSAKLLNLICMDNLLMLLSFEHESEELHCFGSSKFTSPVMANFIAQDC